MAGINVAPWPTERVERLLWLVHGGAVFVVPTAAEQDRMYLEKYGERIEEQRQKSFALQAIRGAFGETRYKNRRRQVHGRAPGDCGAQAQSPKTRWRARGRPASTHLRRP